MSSPHGSAQPDLAALALNDLHAAGFHPEFSSEAQAQTARIEAAAQHPASAQPTIQDLRDLPWSSIDNDTSRDLDQIEVAARLPEGIRLQVAVADVSAVVAKDSPLDAHAAAQTQTVYTAVRNFPMLPVELSTDLTSLNENADRAAVVFTFTVAADGTLAHEQVTLATVRNRAQLAYSRVGPWLEATPASTPSGIAQLRAPIAGQTHSTGALAAPALPDALLADQLHLQDEAAQALRSARTRAGALDFQRAEADPVALDGRITGLQETTHNRAMRLIEDLMVAANGVMARSLRNGQRSGLQRVVRVPQRWDRIVALAGEHNTTLPATPDPVALNHFLEAQRAAFPDLYPDLAVAIIKLLGAGEYVLMRPDDDPLGHFGLAARDYTHSTAPNRRFPDLVTQRCLHAMLSSTPAPYTDDELSAIATHCNEADKALRKIDRAMQKRTAAVALSSHIGQVYTAVVTGSSPKGVYARVLNPPFEGRVLQNETGLDVGARIQVRLLHTDPVRAFIDLARVA